MKIDFKKVLFCFLIAFVFLFIGTKSSPLYVMNDWADANCFFTMGKGMMNGYVPYLNLFEQKGPLLFFIYGLGSLISSTSFIGIFIIEVLAFTIFLYYSFKIVELFLDRKYGFYLIPVISALIIASRSFTHGGSCEELCFSLIMVSLYYFVKYLKTKKISNKEMFIIGLCSGAIFFMKYTLLGFHIGMCLTIFIKSLISKDYKDLFYKIGFFLLGIILMTIPWLIYFIANNGLKEFIDTYFLFNIKNYSDKVDVLDKSVSFFKTVTGVLLYYTQYIILIIIPFIFSIKDKILFKERKNNIYLFVSVLLLLFLIFFGGTNFRYYSLPIQPFMLIGLIIYIKIYKVFNKKEVNNYILKTSLVILASIVYIFLKSPNVSYLKLEKNDYAQYVFADIIEYGTVLNYGFLDGGFYFATDNIPEVLYFQRQNVKYSQYPILMDSQRKYVKDKLTDYVVVKNDLKKDDMVILDSYELVKSHEQIYEANKVVYHLYKKKP